MVKVAQVNGVALFPISTVAEQTGVQAVTLRAWERRYGLLKPHRTPKGHRLYSQQDINRVRQVLRLLEQGIPVGRAWDVLDRDQQPFGTQSADTVPPSPAVDDDPWRQYSQLCRRFVARLDARALDRVVNEAVSLYSLELVAQRLLLPLCRELHGQCCLLASTRSDHAFWYEFLSAKLGAYYLHHNSHGQSTGRRVIILGSACQMVYLQMLLLSGVLAGHGHQTSLLGARCSLEHLPLVLERSEFDAIIYCSPTPEVLAGMEALARLTDTLLLAQYLEDLPEQALPPGVSLLPTPFNEACNRLGVLLQAGTV